MPDQSAGGSAPGSAGQPSSAQSNPANPGLGSVLREQASKFADRSKDAGAETTAAVGKAAESAAEQLQREVPELANYVRSAASYTQRLADDLHSRPAGELLSDAVAWGRKQPLIALAGAAVLGFALSRVIKSGIVESGGGGEQP